MLYVSVTERKMSISLNWTANHQFTVMLQTKHYSIHCILRSSRLMSVLHTLLIKFKRRFRWYVIQRYTQILTVDVNGAWCFQSHEPKILILLFNFMESIKTAELFIPLGRVRFWLWWPVVVCTILFSLHSHQVQHFAKTKPVHAPHTIWYIYTLTSINFWVCKRRFYCDMNWFDRYDTICHFAYMNLTWINAYNCDERQQYGIRYQSIFTELATFVLWRFSDKPFKTEFLSNFR